MEAQWRRTVHETCLTKCAKIWFAIKRGFIQEKRRWTVMFVQRDIPEISMKILSMITFYFLTWLVSTKVQHKKIPTNSLTYLK
jgi:hypothetical protein